MPLLVPSSERKAGEVRPISKATLTSSSIVRPRPPYASGIDRPKRPSAFISATMSAGMASVSSTRASFGTSRSRTKRATVSTSAASVASSRIMGRLRCTSWESRHNSATTGEENRRSPCKPSRKEENHEGQHAFAGPSRGSPGRACGAGAREGGAGASAPLLEAFVRAYYAQVDPDDLAERQLADLYGAALSHFELRPQARCPASAQRARRSIRRSRSTAGSRRTPIIEIVNDDMPFLVDSVTMEANRHGLTLHLIIHPIIDVDARGRRHADGHRRERRRRARAASRSFTSRSTASPARQRWTQLAPRHRARAGRRAARRRRLEARCGDKALAIVGRAREAARRRCPRSELDGRQGVPALAADNHFTFLGYRRHDLVTVDGQDALQHRAGLEPRHPAREGGEGRRRELRRAAAGDPRLRAPAGAARHHQVDVALDGASSRLPRLRRGQALRRCGQRGAARTASSASSRPRPTARTRPTFRCCGARSPTWSRAPASPTGQPRRQGAAQHPRDLSARRAVPDRARTSCCARRSASCICTTGSASASSSAATRSSASCRASSTRRARTTPPTCARSGRRS